MTELSHIDYFTLELQKKKISLLIHLGLFAKIPSWGIKIYIEILQRLIESWRKKNMLTWLNLLLSHLLIFQISMPSQVVQWYKNLPANAEDAEDAGLIPGSGRPLKKETTTSSSILAWKVPWTAEPGGPESMESHRVGHDWAHTCTHRITLRKYEV